jgi:hypothetical protein
MVTLATVGHIQATGKAFAGRFSGVFANVSGYLVVCSTMRRLNENLRLPTWSTLATAEPHNRTKRYNRVRIAAALVASSEMPKPDYAPRAGCAVWH